MTSLSTSWKQHYCSLAGDEEGNKTMLKYSNAISAAVTSWEATLVGASRQFENFGFKITGDCFAESNSRLIPFAIEPTKAPSRLSTSSFDSQPQQYIHLSSIRPTSSIHLESIQQEYFWSQTALAHHCRCKLFLFQPTWSRQTKSRYMIHDFAIRTLVYGQTSRKRFFYWKSYGLNPHDSWFVIPHYLCMDRA